METAQWIQIVFSGALFLATVGLVIVTIIYARATKKMADVMQKEFELRVAPLIEPEIYVHKDALDPMASIAVKNVGSYPVYFSHIFYRWWHREKPADIFKNDIQHVEKWVVKEREFEKRNVKFSFSLLEGFSTPEDVKKNGMATLTLHFLDISGKKFKLLENKILMF
jgi:hypothetical protein